MKYSGNQALEVEHVTGPRYMISPFVSKSVPTKFALQPYAVVCTPCRTARSS